MTLSRHILKRVTQFPHLIRCPVAGYFWKRRFFFLRFNIPSMRKLRFRAPKMQVFYKGPRVQILENAGFSVTSRRTKTMMSCIRTTSITRAPYQMLSYFHRFSVFMWTNEYAICGRVFLKTERKKISGYVWTGPQGALATTMTTATKTLLINLLFKKTLLWFFRLA